MSELLLGLAAGVIVATFTFMLFREWICGGRR